MAADVSYGEYVAAPGGDFARTIDWDEEPEFEGVYEGAVTRFIKGENRTIQTFRALPGAVPEDEDDRAEAWGTAILDARLKNVAVGNRVKITYLGKNAPTKRGVLAHNFDVLHAAPVGEEA
jgi:hypothetical protein